LKEGLFRYPSQLLAGSLCLGLSAANLARVQSMLPLALALLLGGAVAAFREQRSLELVAVALALVGWWWGSARLESLDRSPLSPRL
jgi:hypothetical protein